MILLFRNLNAASARWLGLLLAVAVALLAVFWPRPTADHPSGTSRETLEVLRSELTLRDGRLYRTGDSNAFSGVMIERYSGGALQSRSIVLEGVLDGVSEGWFTNGQLQVTENFNRGVSQGLRTKWYPNGSKLSEANIVEGKLDGLFRKWHENGFLAEQAEFNHGEPNGESLAYFPSGFLKARVRLQAGKVVEQTFWKDGESSDKLLAQDGTP